MSCTDCNCTISKLYVGILYDKWVTWWQFHNLVNMNSFGVLHFHLANVKRRWSFRMTYETSYIETRLCELQFVIGSRNGLPVDLTRTNMTIELQASNFTPQFWVKCHFGSILSFESKVRNKFATINHLHHAFLIADFRTFNSHHDTDITSRVLLFSNWAVFMY